MSSIIIKPETYCKLTSWARSVTTEISWMGLVKFDGKDFRVLDVFLPKQRCHGATTEMEPDSLAEIEGKILAANKFGEDDGQGYLSWWCHTHPKMGVNPSSQDTKQMEEFAAGGWILASIFEPDSMKAKHMFMQFSETLMGKQKVYKDDLTMSIDYSVSDEQIKEWTKEGKDAVLGTPTIRSVHSRNTTHSSNYSPSSYGAQEGLYDWAYEQYGHHYNGGHQSAGVSKKNGKNSYETRSVANHPLYRLVQRTIDMPSEFQKKEANGTVFVAVPAHEVDNVYYSEKTYVLGSSEYYNAVKNWQRAYNISKDAATKERALMKCRLWCIAKGFTGVAEMDGTDIQDAIEFFNVNANWYGWDDFKVEDMRNYGWTLEVANRTHSKGVTDATKSGAY